MASSKTLKLEEEANHISTLHVLSKEQREEASIDQFRRGSLQKTEGTTMNFLDIISPVMMLETAYLLLFSGFMSEGRGNG